MRRVLALVLLAGCGGDDGAPRCRDAFHVCDGHLRDAAGRAVILRGMNVSSGNKAAPYLDFHGEAAGGFAGAAEGVLERHGSPPRWTVCAD